MILLPDPLRLALRANAINRAACDEIGLPFDPPPLLKLFNPLGAATWLATELGEDGTTLFGLADLGLGCPELGYFSLRAISAIHLPFGMRIERDEGFTTPFGLARWAQAAQEAGSIVEAIPVMRRAAADEFPSPPAS